MKRLVWLPLVIAACAPPRPQGPAPARYSFTPVADSLILRSDLNQAHWGIAVFDPARNQYLYHHDGTRHFIPASNTKLVVTTVAMGALGPDWRYRTEVRAVGGTSAEPAQLVVVARGDPTWSARYHADDLTVLDQLADSIRSAGVQRVNELIIDASAFGTERVHSTWEIGDLPFGYAAPTAAFAIAEGTIQLVVTPDTAVGGPASATTLGIEGIFPIRVNVRTDTANARPNVDVDYHAWPDTIVLTGSVPLGRPDTSTLAAPDPQHFAASAFAAALGRKGVSLESFRIVHDSVEAAAIRAQPSRTVTAWTSAPLSAIVAGILQPSQNWIAEQLVRTLGMEKEGNGSWAAGIRAERRFLIDSMKVDSTTFNLRDASGLSAQNLLTPMAIVQLLSYVRQQPWAAAYRAALPTPGLPRSTLSNRLEGFEGKIFAKTGTISNVASLSGYVTTQSGRDLIFSILVNSSGRPSGPVRRGIDALVTALALQRDWE